MVILFAFVVVYMVEDQASIPDRSFSVPKRRGNNKINVCFSAFLLCLSEDLGNSICVCGCLHGGRPGFDS